MSDFEYTDDMKNYVFMRLKVVPKVSNAQIGRELKEIFKITERGEEVIRKFVSRLAMDTNNKRGVKRLFFDIETSPNIGMFWRAGWKLSITPDQIIEERAIICICWKWEGEDKVYSATWDKNKCDKSMLEKFAKVMMQADEVVAHNGDRFDIPWFKTRCLYHRIDAMPKYRSLDTLKKARSHFYFNSNKLDYIAKFLNVGSKTDTGGFQLWKDITLGINDHKTSLKKMVEYCENDVVILEDVFKTLQPYVNHNTNMAVMEGGHKCQCPNCSSREVRLIKSSTTPKGTIRRWMECQDCHQKYDVTNKIYMDFMFPSFKN